MIKVEHKKNDVHRKILETEKEALFWIQGRATKLYTWQVWTGKRWQYTNSPSNRLEAEILIHSVFRGNFKFRKVQYVWSTNSWKLGKAS